MNLVHRVQDRQEMRNCHRKVQAWWPNRRTRHNEGGGTRNGRRKKRCNTMLEEEKKLAGSIFKCMDLVQICACLPYRVVAQDGYSFERTHHQDMSKFDNIQSSSFFYWFKLSCTSHHNRGFSACSSTSLGWTVTGLTTVIWSQQCWWNPPLQLKLLLILFLPHFKDLDLGYQIMLPSFLSNQSYGNIHVLLINNIVDNNHHWTAMTVREKYCETIKSLISCEEWHFTIV